MAGTAPGGGGAVLPAAAGAAGAADGRESGMVFTVLPEPPPPIPNKPHPITDSVVTVNAARILMDCLLGT